MSKSIAHFASAFCRDTMAAPNTNSYLYGIIVFILLMVVWVAFSGFFDLFHLSLGVISCAIVSWLSSDLVFENRQHSVMTRIKQGFALMGYFAWMIWQIVINNFYVLKLTVSSLDKLQPQIVRYKCSLNTDFQRFLLANSITLTPGTVTIKIIGDTFYVHAISDVTAKGLDGEMERRIKKVFAADYESSTASTA